MKTKKRNILIVSAVAASLLSLALAGCHRHRHSQGADLERGKRFVSWLIDDHLTELKATDDQRQQIHAIRDRVYARAEELMTQHRQDRARKGLAFLLEIKKDQPDPDKLHAMIDEGLKKHGQVAHEALDAALEVHAVLTPEQRALLAEKVAEKLRAQ